MRSYGIVAPGTAVPYRHRDPDWVTPARLAELEAADARLVQPQAAWRASEATARQSRVARFTQLREEGLTVREAAARMHVSLDTGRKYERARLGRS